MGLSPFGTSNSARDRPGSATVYSDPVNRQLPNPNKYRWVILEHYILGKAAVVVIKYKDCTNYDGIKILVYDDSDKFEELRTGGAIDPHFSEDEYSPVARFVPTDKGIEQARQLAKTL